jgi:hypothetical protein
MACRCAMSWFVLGLVCAAACGSGPSARPDAAVEVDAAPDAPGAPDAPAETAITIKVFPDLVPTYTGRTENAALVALQDGDGPWVALTGTGGVYGATVTGRRYAVAVGCTGPDPSVQLYYQSVSDTAEVLADGCASTRDTVRISVDVLGMPSTESAEVWVGRGVGFAFDGQPAQIDHPKGSADLFVRSAPDQPGPPVPVKLYRGPTLNLVADLTMEVDIEKLGLPPERHAVTVVGRHPPGSVSETFRLHSSYATRHSELQWPLATTEFADGEPVQFMTIDASQRQVSDVSNLTAIATGTTTDGREYMRFTRLAMRTPVAQTLQLPPIWTAGTPTMDRSAVPRAILTIPMTPPTLGHSDYFASFSTFDGVEGRVLLLRIEPGWALGASSVTITTPDLSSLPGWHPDMALQSGTPVNWTIEWYDRNMLYHVLPIDGRRIHGSIITGLLGP